MVDSETLEAICGEWAKVRAIPAWLAGWLRFPPAIDMEGVALGGIGVDG